MSEFWVKESCPECSAINWVHLPDGDNSTMSVDGYKCRKCEHIKYFGDNEMYEFDAEMGAWESVEDCYWELGLETPE
jgi:hypothetical protein